jgi:D-sedoheptulose 7-phosphate isomerase
VIKAVELARKAGLTTVCFVGHEGSPLARLGDIALSVPSPSTARIQEVHLLAIHCLCDLIDAQLLGLTQ